jgi:general secretion pathway protein A
MLRSISNKNNRKQRKIAKHPELSYNGSVAGNSNADNGLCHFRVCISDSITISMYKDYFGFTENPFSIAPDPRYLYMSEMHQEALAHLNYGADSDGCIVLLTGEIGTGKTTICRCWLEQLGDNSDVAIVLNPKLTAFELLATICDEFGLHQGGSSAPTIKEHIDRLNEFLLTAHAENRQALLVIDEAQNLDLDVLEMLRLLTNLETNRQKLLKIFLLGQSELGEILGRPDLNQISQRITSRYHLQGLHKDDVDAYIIHRITVAGGGRARLFSKGAVRRIFALTRGVPRLINSLCDRALLGAYTENKDRVDERIVKRAAGEIFGETVKPCAHGLRLGITALAVVLMLCIITGFWVLLGTWYLQKDETSPDTKPALTEISLQKSGDSEALPTAAEQLPDEGDPPEAANEELWSLVPEESSSTGDETITTRIIIEPIEIAD